MSADNTHLKTLSEENDPSKMQVKSKLKCTPQVTSSLKRKRTESGKKFYKCLLCTYKSTLQDNLDDHMSTHTEDLFNCSFCPYRAISRDNFETHVKIHTSKTFRCDFCRYKTINQRNFDLHIKTHEFYAQRNTDKLQSVKWNLEEKRIVLQCYQYAQFEKWSLQKNAIFIEEVKNSNLGEEKKNTPLNKLLSLVSQIHRYFTEEEIRIMKEEAYKKAFNDYHSQDQDDENVKKKRKSSKESQKWTLETQNEAGQENIKIHIKTHSNKVEGPFKCNFCSYQSSRKGKLYNHLAAHMMTKSASKHRTQKPKSLRWTIDEKRLLLYCFEYSRFEKWISHRNAILDEKLKSLNFPPEKKNISFNKLQSLVSQMHKYLSDDEIASITDNALKTANEDYETLKQEGREFPKGRHEENSFDLNFDIEEKDFEANSKKKSLTLKWSIQEKKILLYCYEYAQFEKWNKQKNVILVEEIKNYNLPQEKRETPLRKLQSLVSQMHKYLTSEEINAIKQKALEKATADYLGSEDNNGSKKRKRQKGDQATCDASGKENIKFNIKTHNKTDSFKCKYCPYETLYKGRLYVHFETHVEEIMSKTKLYRLKTARWSIEEKKTLLFCYEYADHGKVVGNKNEILVEQIKKSDLPDEKKNTQVSKLQSLVSQMHKYLTKTEIDEIKELALKKAQSELKI